MINPQREIIVGRRAVKPDMTVTVYPSPAFGQLVRSEPKLKRVTRGWRSIVRWKVTRVPLSVVPVNCRTGGLTFAVQVP